MHQLDRTKVPTPPCLVNYRHGVNNWGDVVAADKEEIRQHLEQMQGRRCAYCECSLDVFGGHVEHFWPKGDFPKLTFDWSNLFWSCSQADSCGHYKDNGAGPYKPSDLVNPCNENPERFLHFIRDGSIRLRGGLNSTDQHHANETLRVFSLDADFGRLRKLREVRVKQYTQMDPDILTDLPTFSEVDRRAYIEAEIAATAHEPFATTIKHFLESLL